MNNVEPLNLAITYLTLGINAFVLVQCLLAKKHHQYYLAVFFFASLINYLDDIFWLTEGWRLLPAVTNAYIPFTFLIPAALYLYIQSLIKPAKPLQLYSKHWLGFVFAFICCLPYFWLDSATKISRLTSEPGTLSHHGLITWGPTIALMLFIPFGLIYILLCLNLLHKNQRRVKAFFSNIEDKTLSWVRWAILILILAWTVATIELLLPSHITENSYWPIGFAVFELLWLWVFSHFALQQKVIPPTALDEKKNTNHFESKKYQRAPLDDNEVKHIKISLGQAIDQQLHRQAELSLQTLSEQLEISINKISQVLNVHMKTGFYDFINKSRVSDACQQLTHTGLNIIDIAYLVGFNSKSTFNSAFKKHTGITPSLYKKQNS